MREEGFQGAPKPANFDAMCKAWNDPVAFAREVAIYNEQLVASGHPTVYKERDHWRAQHG